MWGNEYSKGEIKVEGKMFKLRLFEKLVIYTVCVYEYIFECICIYE